MIRAFYFFLCFTLLLELSAQNHRDTVVYMPIVCDSSSGIMKCSGGMSYQLEEGFNQIYDTTGLLLMEGMVRTYGNFRHFLNFGKIRFKGRTGLWTYYCEGRKIASISYDKKGNELGRLSYYNNGQIHLERYRSSSKSSWEISNTYFKDGRMVRTATETMEYIEALKKEKCLIKNSF